MNELIRTLRGLYKSILLSSPLLPFIAFAQTPPAQPFYQNPITYTGSDGKAIHNIPQFLLAMVDLAFLVIMPIIVIFIIYAGFLFLTAGDNESKVSTAKKALLWALVGAAVALGAKVISMAIEATILEIGAP
jgi:hypothetical protein